MRTLLLSLCCFCSLSLFAAEEATLSIIKPNAVADNHVGEIIARFEKNGLRVSAAKMTQLSRQQVEEFYSAHKGKPFFEGLTEFMSSGPVVILVLKGDNAVAKNRDIMGATDPKQAAQGTIRADFAKNIDANAVHGSDSQQAAKEEIHFFFKDNEIVR